MRRIPREACALLPATSRPWQARGNAAVEGAGSKCSRRRCEEPSCPPKPASGRRRMRRSNPACHRYTGLLRGACHRERVRATRWLAMTILACSRCGDVKSFRDNPPMSVNFEELDFRPTPMGTLSLRRRRSLTSGLDIYEIKLGDEFLMSSAFTAAEIALARLGLAALKRSHLDVVLGGLGPGYTAPAPPGHAAGKTLILVDG